MSQALDRVRQAARLRKKEKFTALFHHLSIDLFRESFFALKRDAAPGVDGLTWQTYEADLDRKLTDLHSRVQRGAYRALPSRRAYIPKADGKQKRPLAVAALEDKIVQRATVAVLNCVYEEEFLGFSYGFRPKRGQHDALDALVVGITTRRVNFIFDADVASFFNSVSKNWLVRFVEHRIGDKRIIRLIRKWLKAGVLEDGVVTVSEMGTGQGSVISPLLANIYMHYVLDLWANRWRQREAQGDMVIVRYADDFVVGWTDGFAEGSVGPRPVRELDYLFGGVGPVGSDRHSAERRFQMSPLRMRMIEDMKLAGLSPGTQATYIDAVRKLAAYYRRSPDQLSEEEVRAYILHLRERGSVRGTFKANYYGIQYLYRYTVSRDWALFAKKRSVCRDRSGCPARLPTPRSAGCLAA